MMKRLASPGIVFLLLALGVARLFGAGTGEPRERLLLDFGWRFHLGNDWGIGQNLAKSGSGYGPAGTVFSDASWRRVDLPHDWAIELPFDPKADAAHGFRPVGPGFPDNSVGWYRRTFALPREDAGRRLWLEFDGAFRDCAVFVNGWFVGRHEGGYNGFRYDITDVANCGGENVVAVRVDASEFEGWFYEGAGLYRHVWLVKTSPLAVAPDGVFVSCRFPDIIPSGPAEVLLETRLLNTAPAPADANVTWQILAPNGRLVASERHTARIGAATAEDFRQTLKIEAPELWSPETPRLYKLVTTVTDGGATVDRVETTFGVRTVAFDAGKGFLLNGRPYLIKGTCNHQDHAGVGAALPDRLQEFRLEQLKKLGSNAYRTAHHPPTAELLDACDRLGLLVMDESRLLGSDAENLRKWEQQIRRDRNHPSVAIWSLANEEFNTQATPAGARVAAAMQAFVKRLDPMRPVTYNAPVGNEFAGINSVIEVRGWSYRIGADRMDAYHAAHPDQPNVGSEQGSTTTTRGIYANDPSRGYMSAYDDNKESWSNTAQEWMTFFDPRPWLSGGFVWTGFDYRGEPTPYAWPCVNSHFGIFDTCGFPKDNFWYYQAWWTPQPVLHLLPHWNWPGREGREIDVRALTNCDEVELLLNGRSLGRQTPPRLTTPRWTVAYAPGVLSAKGFKAGRLVAETAVATTGAPAAVALAPDRAAIPADGEDVSVVTVSIVDAQGSVVPVAGDAVDFELEGPGRIIGVGNGDPSSHEPDTFISAPVVHARPIAGWRRREIADPYAAVLPETAAGYDDAAWAAADLDAEGGLLGMNSRAVFRAVVTVTEEELAAPGLELWFGRIAGDGFVFVNGGKIGPTGDARGVSVYDVKARLHPGENTIAVALATYGSAGGLGGGAALRRIEPGAPVAWRRSVFNGLAQVIVQSAKTAGELKLTARAAGLQPATVVIRMTPAIPRPALP
jgi:beta-galactosidase